MFDSKIKVELLYERIIVEQCVWDLLTGTCREFTALRAGGIKKSKSHTTIK